MPKTTKYILVLLILVLLVGSFVTTKIRIETGQIALLVLLIIVILIDRIRSFKVGGNEVVLSDSEVRLTEEVREELIDTPEESMVTGI